MAFGNIEKSVRATGDIHDFCGYCAAIKASVVERQTVYVMRQQDFFSLDVLQKEITLRRPQAPYGFQDARRFSLKSQFCSGYYASMGYEGPLGSVHLQKGTATKNPASFNQTRVIVPQKYDAPRRLKPGKVKALQYLLDYIPPAHNCCIQYIINGQENLDVTEDIDNGLDDNLDYDDEGWGGGGGGACPPPHNNSNPPTLSSSSR